MIITKTPMRIALGGGGTDIPEFYWEHGGFWISTAIDKFVYVAIKPRFEKQIRLAYSKIELVDDIAEIEHPILRTALDIFGVDENIEISTLADLPSGTGMGSSGSFTVGLVNALSVYTGKPIQDLADMAFFIEREKLGRPIGKQDQYAALYGGVRLYRADKKGRITHAEMIVPGLEDRLSLFYTSIRRDSTPVLKDVADNPEGLQQIKNIGEMSWDALHDQKYDDFGGLLHQHWLIKREMSSLMTSDKIDKTYQRARKAGALGGKIIGAGGGGFFMFYTRDDDGKAKLIREMAKIGLPHQPFRFHNEGTKVLDI